MSYFFYIVRCSDNSLYCGIAKNLVKRIHEHNHDPNKGAKYTKGKRPVKLVYSELHKDISSALKREHEVKTWSKAKKEKLIG